MGKLSEIDKYLCRLQDGDDDALGDVYDLSSGALYALCLEMLKNESDAQDALQDVYLTAKRYIDYYERRSGFNWLYTITKNRCLNLIKKRKRDVLFDFDDEESVNSLPNCANDGLRLSDEENIGGIMQAVLTNEERLTVDFHVIRGYKFREIAAIVNRPESTVRWNYRNALGKVRKEYKRRYGE